jgi:hypothetical protein
MELTLFPQNPDYKAIIYEPGEPNPDKAYINSQLKILCQGTELNYEYAFMSMMGINKHTLVIKHTTPGTWLTRSMSKIIGFVTYSKHNDYKDCISGYTIDAANTLILGEILNGHKYMTFGKTGCIAIDVIVTGQGAKGLGTFLLKHFNKDQNVFLKSVETAYWFYIKQGFKHFYKKSNNQYIELPYKSCGRKHYFNFPKPDPACPDFTSNFQSWYKKDYEEDELPDDDNELIPLILPTPPPTPTPAGGASNKSFNSFNSFNSSKSSKSSKSFEYITVLGRRRKIVMQGRKQMVMVSGDLISLSDAKKKQ